MGKVYFSTSVFSLLCRRRHLALLHALGHACLSTMFHFIVAPALAEQGDARVLVPERRRPSDRAQDQEDARGQRRQQRRRRQLGLCKPFLLQQGDERRELLVPSSSF
jgi:hypothetical protein